MKGVVFTEFLDFVGDSFGQDMVDDIIEDAAPENGGAYTAVGTYSYAEMGALVGALSKRSGRPASELLQAFGRRLCLRFTEKFAHFFAARTNLFDFLASVDGYIHVEVHKLYPDAELPRFTMARRDDDAIDLDYASCRPLEALAEGMIRQAAEHFGEPIHLVATRIDGPDGAKTRFTIARASVALAAA